MLINHPDRVLGDPDALYCKSQGGGTSATLDQWRSQLSHGLEPVCHQRTASLPCFDTSYIQSDSDSQVSAADLGSPQQCSQLFRAIKRSQAPLSAKSKSQRYSFPLMETKTTTHHAITRGRVELYSSSLTVTCEASGDSIELSLPYGTFRDALKEYVVHRLSRSTQEELISLMTEELRKRDEAEASA